MNDRNKEAFEKWFISCRDSPFAVFLRVNYPDIGIKWDRESARSAWQAACEFKDKSLINGTRMKQMNEEIERLKAENAKLKECVNIYANKYAWHGTHINSDDLWFDETQGYFTGGKHARQVLEELEDK